MRIHFIKLQVSVLFNNFEIELSEKTNTIVFHYDIFNICNIK